MNNFINIFRMLELKVENYDHYGNLFVYNNNI